MKLALLLLAMVCSTVTNAQNASTGIFKSSADIGSPKLAGSTSYDEATQTYTLKGAGSNIWFNRDEFHYLYNRIGGDFLLTADVEFDGTGGDPHRKIGWMIRESSDASAASINAVIHGDGLTVMQWRPLRGAFMRDPEDEIFYSKKTLFRTIQLERMGRKIIMRVANSAEPLQDVAVKEMPDMKDSVLVGLFISSHDSTKTESFRAWNVRIDKPVPETFHPNPQVKLAPLKGVVGCRLEVMDIADGKRLVIRESKGRFEAPNWMPDGQHLLYNESGALFLIPVKGGDPQKLDVGSATGLNNDHGISFNGKMLAISHALAGKGGSVVSILPLTGGTPKAITELNPSYWHGWSPSAKEVLVVGQRNNSKIYNVYKIDVNTLVETPLTNNTTGHVDGPEYSPDGKYIYYNANPTGTMQIWRMKPDGSAKEQLTFDEYHNWFPHISPDGKWMTIISFPTDIDPGSHPANKKVMLRLMPVGGGAPRVIAYLYGGQGTINVNSWSPDSKRIAFVSNSQQY